MRTRIEPPLGVFMAEGALVIERALLAGYQPRSALVSPRWLATLEPMLGSSDAPVYVGDEPLLEAITGFHVHRGALGAMQRRPLPAVVDVLAGARRVAVLEDMVGHTNLGAVFRSAGALGMDAVLLSPSCADPLYRRSVRVSMGGVFSLPWARLPAEPTWPRSLQAVRDAGFAVWALTPATAAEPLPKAVEALPPQAKVALLLGTEGDGLRSRTLAGADRQVAIPMARGVDSLNVAAAAAVAFYALGG